MSQEEAKPTPRDLIPTGYAGQKYCVMVLEGNEIIPRILAWTNNPHPSGLIDGVNEGKKWRSPTVWTCNEQGHPLEQIL